MGLFIATRSPKCLRFLFCAASSGMLIDLFDELGAHAIVKGIRNERDLEYELIHAKWNKEHNDRAETLLLPADEGLSAVSSTMVRELINAKSLEALEGIMHEQALKWIKDRY